MKQGQRRRSVDEEARVRRVELVLRMPREPPVQSGVDDGEKIEAKCRPEPYVFARMSEEPYDERDERNVEKNERSPSQVVGHAAKDEQETPFTLVYGIEFVSEERRTRQVEYEISNAGHRCERLSAEKRGIMSKLTGASGGAWC